MFRIRDPLHGTIALTGTEERLLDCCQMQRLRGIRQLATGYLVYPGANHTRFEHSIGTLFLADRMCREMGMTEERISKVRAAALLHDIGHVAFSHESEAVLKARLGTHEEVGKRLALHGEVADALSSEFSPREIADVCDTTIGSVITSDIGADRMDYLLRDSHYTGVAYGVIDTQRICTSVSLGRKGLLIRERGLEAAESLLVARITMFSTVYLHKTVRIASRMLQQAIMLALEDGTLCEEDFLSFGDSQALDALGASPRAHEYAARIKKRHLFKKAYSVPMSKMRMPARKAEEELTDACGCPVLVDIPNLSAKAHILLEKKDGKILPLARESELVSALVSMQSRRLEALVMCDERHVKKVARAAKRLFG
ncbi:MAG: HD domain-containing protein [Candidatus Micrarchaeota archaeon]|nr:HD domain-containing protein [Candidatus Micrarchaeota archaeon]